MLYWNGSSQCFTLLLLTLFCEEICLFGIVTEVDFEKSTVSSKLTMTQQTSLSFFQLTIMFSNRLCRTEHYPLYTWTACSLSQSMASWISLPNLFPFTPDLGKKWEICVWVCRVGTVESKCLVIVLQTYFPTGTNKFHSFSACLKSVMANNHFKLIRTNIEVAFAFLIFLNQNKRTRTWQLNERPYSQSRTAEQVFDDCQRSSEMETGTFGSTKLIYIF